MHPTLFLRNRLSNQQKILDLRLGGQNQHVCRISLNSERVGFRIVFILGDLAWNNPMHMSNQ